MKDTQHNTYASFLKSTKYLMNYQYTAKYSYIVM